MFNDSITVDHMNELSSLKLTKIQASLKELLGFSFYFVLKFQFQGIINKNDNCGLHALKKFACKMNIL